MNFENVKHARHYGKLTSELESGEMLLFIADSTMYSIMNKMDENKPNNGLTPTMAKSLNRLARERHKLASHLLENENITKEEVEKTRYSFDQYLRDRSNNEELMGMGEKYSEAENGEGLVTKNSNIKREFKKVFE